MKYFTIIKLIFIAYLQYKVDFFVGIGNQILVIFFELLGMISLFKTFGTLNDWSVSETLLIYGIVNFSFSFAEVFYRGFESGMESLIRNGEYDRYLLRPYSTILQISAFNFQPIRFGRLTVALFVLVFAIVENISFDNWCILLFYIPFVIVCGCFLYSGIYLFIGSLTFLFNQFMEFTSIFVQGSVSMMQYPKDSFPRVIQNFFTFILPVSLISYYPVIFALQKSGEKNLFLNAVSPIAGIIFYFISVVLFKYLEQRYLSSGS
ncbi:ABC transporter permease [Streptococcus oralis]|uniref:ABC transporter permease n=1 Tax=Streptococcus oralis TaxID=1303 RepID=UPI00228527F7|nr:ABC-2 family transporter protein [Streptococcus oralis]MCY7079212.1 ABC-2 family transporter protein [Streptococcus oralis]